MKNVTIYKFSPTKVVLTDGTILEAPKGREFDYDIIKKIVEYGNDPEPKKVNSNKDLNEPEIIL